MDKQFDAHCHYFNGKYLCKEILAILWAWMRGTYPNANAHHWKARPGKMQPRLPGKLSLLIPEIESLAHYLAGLLTVATESCEDNYLFELSQYAQSNGGGQLVTAPLMMDIFYVIADATADSAPRAMPTSAPQEAIHAFANYAGQLKEMVFDSLRHRSHPKRMAPQTVHQLRASLSSIEQTLGTAIAECVKHLEEIQPPRDRSEPELSWGYAGHLNELTKLKKKFGDRVYPFLAVDPRRRGVTDLVKQQAGNGKPFRGVKIYPPLGYLPDDPKLAEIYAFCKANKLPIVTHASPGGFKSLYWRGPKVPPTDDTPLFPNRREHYFAHPGNWAPVLKKFPSLLISFAHFGGFSEAKAVATGQVSVGNWTAEILEFMDDPDYPNVYADVSYFPDPNGPEVVQRILDRHPSARQRVLFGTDYVMLMLDKQLNGAMDSYFNRFLLMPDRFALFTNNPARFLSTSRKVAARVSRDRCAWNRP